MQKVYLVGCSGEKLAEASAAKSLYTSERFRLSREVAENFADSWYVVSAQHGLLNPDTTISPYDATLSGRSESEIRLWAKQCAKAIPNKLRGSQIVVLAHDEYAMPLANELQNTDFHVTLPFLNRDRNGILNWLTTVLGSSNRSKHLDRFYTLLSRLQTLSGSTLPFRECIQHAKLPTRGLYLFFEHDQRRIFDNGQQRVVRVGTHAVSRGSKSTLRARLRTHLGTASGGGSHRSSIMRLHIGNALIAREGDTIESPEWGKGQVATVSVRNLERPLEQRVSEYIGRMQILWLAIDDEPSPQSDRAYIEQNSIGLIAGCGGPVDTADMRWLGMNCPNPAIQRSSLWNVNYVDGKYDPDFLEVFQEFVEITLGRVQPPNRSIAPSNWHNYRYGKECRGQLNLFGDEDANN